MAQPIRQVVGDLRGIEPELLVRLPKRDLHFFSLGDLFDQRAKCAEGEIGLVELSGLPVSDSRDYARIRVGRGGRQCLA